MHVLKKRETPRSDDEESERGKDERPVDIDTILIAGQDRGLNFQAIQDMEVGQVVDYVIQWNIVHDTNDDEKEKKNKPKIRKATQADWDAFF